MPFFLLFVLVPITELWLLFRVAEIIGGGWTLLLVILTAMIGVSLLKRQGLQTLLQMQGRMQAGQLPVDELAQGVMLAVAGALLLTPGLITDCMGFALLNPVFRRQIARRVLAKMAAQVQVRSYHQGPQSGAAPHARSNAGRPQVFEGEFERESDSSQPSRSLDDSKKP